MKKISVVLFDFGNVLVQIDTESFWRHLGLANPVKKAPYHGRARDLYLSIERGELGEDAFVENMHQLFGGAFERDHLRQAFLSIIQEPVAGMERIVQRTSQLVQTALVSNTNSMHYEYSQKKVPAVALLHDHFVSFRMGVLKPSHEFYEHILRNLNVPAEATLFVDDMQENVDGALAAGMRAHRFTSVSELEHSLEVMHVLQ